MMKLLLLLASAFTLTTAQWEPEQLPVFMPSTQHELEHYEPVADKASVVLSPMAGERWMLQLPCSSMLSADNWPGGVCAWQRHGSPCSRIASSAWNTASRASSRCAGKICAHAPDSHSALTLSRSIDAGALGVQDKPTLGFLNRKTAPVKFSQVSKGDTITIKTSALTLTYSGGKFSSKSLHVSGNGGAFKSW
eukprot:COSAG02_NODE_21385_length_790_cov_1.069465_1_plen_192_part_01